MKVIQSERVVFCDVDDTLVMHTHGATPSDLVVDVPCRVTGETLRMVVNEAMVRLVKEEQNRGATIIVWSRGGFQWAKDVVEAVGLKSYVTLVMSKPITYFDDKPVDEWLKDRVYLSPTTPYKKNIAFDE